MKTTLEFEHGEETQAKIAQGSYDAYCSLQLFRENFVDNGADQGEISHGLKLILDQWYTTEDLDG